MISCFQVSSSVLFSSSAKPTNIHAYVLETVHQLGTLLRAEMEIHTPTLPFFCLQEAFKHESEHKLPNSYTVKPFVYLGTVLL